jgi:hypothetical protein
MINQVTVKPAAVAYGGALHWASTVERAHPPEFGV